MQRNVDIFGARWGVDGFSQRSSLRTATQKYSESYLKMQSCIRTEIYIFFDLMAQYHCSKQATDTVGPAITDEGFLHRGSAIFLYPNAYSGIDCYLQQVPCFDTVIHVEWPIDLAIERCK